MTNVSHPCEGFKRHVAKAITTLARVRSYGIFELREPETGLPNPTSNL